MSSHDDLPFGLYERLLTIGLRAKLLRIDPTRVRIVTKDVEPAELHETLARHLAETLAQALNGVSDPDRVVRQAEIANSLIGHLADQVVDPILVDATVHTPPQQLHAVHALTGAPGDDREVVAPLLDLSASDLLVNARGEPALAHALSREIPSADSIDLLCAFVQWHGLRLIEVQLKEHRRLGRPLRVITTVFTGSTERKALDWLVAQGAEVKVSYDTQSTRLAAFYHWHERHSLSLAVRVAIGHPTAHRA